MPIAIAPLIAFALGVAFALREGGPIERDAPIWPLSRSTAIVLLFALLVFAPVHAYFLWRAGDWSFAYLIDSDAVPSAVSFCVVLADAALVVIGYRAARQRAHDPRATLLMLVLPLGAAAIVVAMLASRLGLDATTHQVEKDYGTRPIGESPLGLAILWMDALLIAGAVLTARDLERPSGPRPHRRRANAGDAPRRLGLGASRDDARSG